MENIQLNDKELWLRTHTKPSFDSSLTKCCFISLLKSGPSFPLYRKIFFWWQKILSHLQTEALCEFSLSPDYKSSWIHPRFQYDYSICLILISITSQLLRLYIFYYSSLKTSATTMTGNSKSPRLENPTWV